MTLSPSQIFAGRSIFMLGGTGFLGKVCLSLLLDRFPDIGHIYLMVRAGSAADSERRFWESLLPSPAFDPLRRRYGRSLEALLREKVCILNGDIRQEALGLSEEDAARIASEIDVLLNCSGRVTFNPPLESALSTNVRGTLNTIAFARRMRRPALVHVSTCFVAGNRSGEIWENEPIIHYFPRRSDPAAPDFSVDQEIADCERLVRRVNDEADDAMRAARFREEAVQRLELEGRDPGHERTLRAAIVRERKNWVRQRLTRLGLERARYWGWPNIYTYTKSLGEQLVAREAGIVRSIVRPAIVEGAMEFPCPGWNEGFTTTAPLSHLGLKGQNLFPVNTELILDVIPVDYAAGAVLAVTAQACVEEPALVHQLSSGDQNPARLGRIVGLLGLYKRRHFEKKATGNPVFNRLASEMEAEAVRPDVFERLSLPMFHHAARAVTDFLAEKRPHGLGPLDPLLEQIQKGVEQFKDFAAQGEEQYRTFRPFIVENNYIFRADNTRALFQRLTAEDRERLPWSPETIDWYHYWLNVHLPGLERWVFPKLDEEGKAGGRRIYTYGTLNELFDTTTRLHAGRVAIRIERRGREETYTYGDLRECTLRAAAFLTAHGIAPGDRIGLLAENSPEWGMSYFGILKAGATCIPIEKDASTEEVANLLLAAEAAGIVLSDDLRRRHPDLAETLAAAGRPAAVWTFGDVFALGDERVERERVAALPGDVRPDSRASIIFTSGTTGRPKGVILTHHNFTSVVAKLLSVYELNRQDGLLSILPLHHVFEFTTGFLLPLSRGAQITYLTEITGESITRTLRTGRITCIVGVPAVWDLLKRRILGELSQRVPRAAPIVTALIDGNFLLRDETPFNLGPLVFAPVHKALGGRLRYLISGGAALSDETLKTFRGLGFNLNQGYGLTEAAPVLTVTRPDGRVVPGSVGQPLPGIDVRLKDPDRRGVGEVIARGPNVTPGYYGNDEATRDLIVGGWLHTGDLGRFDEEGNLFIVGRLKEVIVDSNGKNVYPEELEALYAEPSLIKDLAVVGLPDGTAERVACVAVPNDDGHEDVEALRALIESHFQRVSARLPFYKRVKTLHIWDGELPRTATRKVKRREIARTLQRLRAAAPGPADSASAGEERDMTALLGIIADVANRPRGSVSPHTRFDELGFDSLMYTELAAALDAAGGESVGVESLMSVADVSELADQLGRLPAAGPGMDVRTSVGAAEAEREPRAEDFTFSPAIVRAGRQVLGTAQRWLYQDFLDTEIRGRSHVPAHTHFIIAANHASHLDMGLVKIALGDAGRNLVVLAAADYFFDNEVKRALIENFTNLVPLERKGSLRNSLKMAFHLLEQGHNVLIFPEGTRSRSGRIQPFQRGLGHLALRARIGVLPVYLSTFGAMPPGAWYPHSRKVAAMIGPFVSYELFERLTAGLPRSEAERIVTVFVQEVVERLERGEPVDPEARATELRRTLKTERPAGGALTVSEVIEDITKA